MTKNGLMADLGCIMYKIEVEMNTHPDTDPVFELVRRKGGKVDDNDDLRQDTGFNSKDHDFIPLVIELGLGEQLLEAVKEAYKI